MAAIVAWAADAADEAVLEAMGFNAFARDLAEAVHEMAAADADEAVLEALGFNAFARELGQAVHDMAALDAALDDALGTFASQIAEATIHDMEAADDADEEAAVQASGFDDFVRERTEAIADGIIEAVDAEGPALDVMEFDAFARELIRDIHARDEEAYLQELYCDKISRAIDRALDYQREEAGAAAAAMPRHVACG